MAKKNEVRERIQRELIEKLEQSGTAETYYTSLICDYMSMWDAKNLLFEDIKRRGVTVTAANGSIRKNESVGELVKLNAQMLKLLCALGIKPEPSGGEDDEL